MCTVTFVPNGPQGFVLTQSRDEHVSRLPAEPPVVKQLDGVRVLHPVDGDAGGTWMAVSEAGRAVCLMNGAFEPHERNPPYRRSRGLVLLDSIAQPLKRFASSYAFEGIEPFTMVSCVLNAHQVEVNELRWDGQRVHVSKVGHTQPQIWSSAPLYSPVAMREREAWFAQWQQNRGLQPEQVLGFHQQGGAHDRYNGIRMSRSNGLGTVSITQVRATAQAASMHYHDLRTDSKALEALDFSGL